MRQFVLGIAILAGTVNSALASEPKSNSVTAKKSTRTEIGSFQRLLARLDERDRQRQRCAIEILPALILPQPGKGISQINQVYLPMTLPSPHYLEHHSPMYFPEQPDFPLPRELAYQEETAGLINPKDKAKAKP